MLCVVAKVTDTCKNEDSLLCPILMSEGYCYQWSETIKEKILETKEL